MHQDYNVEYEFDLIGHALSHDFADYGVALKKGEAVSTGPYWNSRIYSRPDLGYLLHIVSEHPDQTRPRTPPHAGTTAESDVNAERPNNPEAERVLTAFAEERTKKSSSAKEKTSPRSLSDSNSALRRSQSNTNISLVR